MEEKSIPQLQNLQKFCINQNLKIKMPACKCFRIANAGRQNYPAKRDLALPDNSKIKNYSINLIFLPLYKIKLLR